MNTTAVKFIPSAAREALLLPPKLAVVLVAMTTAAAAQPPMPHGPQYYACYTDEGQGRFVPCDVG
jgi:hypothetical protein